MSSAAGGAVRLQAVRGGVRTGERPVQLTCVEMITRPVRALQIYRIFFSCTKPRGGCPFWGALCVQPVSVDEVFLEYPAGTDGLFVAQALRDKIFATTRCPASAGIGPNMLLARLATMKVSPAHQLIINVHMYVIIKVIIPCNTIG